MIRWGDQQAIGDMRGRSKPARVQVDRARNLGCHQGVRVCEAFAHERMPFGACRSLIALLCACSVLSSHCSSGFARAKFPSKPSCTLQSKLLHLHDSNTQSQCPQRFHEVIRAAKCASVSP